MSTFLTSYLIVALAGVLAVVLAGGTLLLGRLVRPSRPRSEKLIPYESGADPSTGGWSQTYIRYYLYALLFVVFDVEIAFIVPWAIQVESFGIFGLFEMLLFVAILALGLAYAWRKGVLRWDS